MLEAVLRIIGLLLGITWFGMLGWYVYALLVGQDAPFGLPPFIGVLLAFIGTSVVVDAISNARQPYK